MTSEEQLRQLMAKLDQLSLQQQRMGTEIIHLREQINTLKSSIQQADTSGQGSEMPITSDEIPEVKIDLKTLESRSTPPPLPKAPVSAPIASTARESLGPANKKKSFDLEGFIGGNLINKIGILILIVGLGLFAKYAIDNGYFPPVVRLVGSFLAGLALVLIGYRLKPKYKTYSAVLFSGGMAVVYFSAYGGNAFYEPALLPRSTAFILMIVFTIVTVLAALLYNLQIIALLGMVGAYAVPLLLSDDSGNYIFFLAYIAVINTGILLVCIRQFWRLTLYSSMILTWLIYAFWLIVEYDEMKQTSEAWLFNVLFFGLFYTALIVFNLRKKRVFTYDNISFIILNAFVFYGLGMVLLDALEWTAYEGVFALANGLLHLGLAYGLYRTTVDKKFFYALSGLFWVFLTISIGVQFEAANTALLWLGEAVVLFWIGRRTAAPIFEGGAFLVLFLGAVLLVDYWNVGYYEGLVHLKPILNSYFASSGLALLGLGIMLWISQRWDEKTMISDFSNKVIGAVFLVVLYFAFYNEIYHQSEMTYLASYKEGQYQLDLLRFKNLWLLYYSLSFVLGIYLVNQVWLKWKILYRVSFILSMVLIIIFISIGLYDLNGLRRAYLQPELSPIFSETSSWLWIRYVGYGLLGAVTYQVHQTGRQLGLWKSFGQWLVLFTHFLVLVFLSNELSTFLTMAMEVKTDSLVHRVGYSIMWALYALGLIFLGFRKQSKLLRVAGIILFGLTLVKIFLVDLIDISTESRIFLFVAVGILLLVTSYLYQKYAEVLLGEEGKEEV